MQIHAETILDCYSTLQYLSRPCPCGYTLPHHLQYYVATHTVNSAGTLFPKLYLFSLHSYAP